MLKRTTAWIILAVVLPLGGCLAPDAARELDAAERITFQTAVIDPSRSTKEPGLFSSERHGFFVCGTRGVGLGTDLWRSQDGREFEYLATTVLPGGRPVRSLGGDVGGGDCDVAADAAGTLYLVDLWGGGISVSVSRDGGDSWAGRPASTLGVGPDRPWAAGGTAEEVFVLSPHLPPNWEFYGLDSPPAGGILVARSVDGGQTFPQQVTVVSNERSIGRGTNLAAGGDDLFLAYAKKTSEGALRWYLARSSDRGVTWDHFPVFEQGFASRGCDVSVYFPALAADEAGGVYMAWNLVDAETHLTSVWFASSPDRGEHWTGPLRVTDRGGTFLMPWVEAAGPGRVGIVWYESNVSAPREFDEQSLRCHFPGAEQAEWFLHYAFSADATALRPTFQEVRVQPEPVHRGPLTGQFAEFMKVRFDPLGRAAVAYVADVLEGEARPMFALQAAGPLGVAAADSASPAPHGDTPAPAHPRVAPERLDAEHTVSFAP